MKYHLMLGPKPRREPPLIPGPHMVAVYKAPHEWAGEEVERGRLCVCEAKWFPQWVVSQAFLDEMTEGRRVSLLESCEVITYKKGQAAWFPKLCHHCTRRQIETFNVLQRYEKKSA